MRVLRKKVGCYGGTRNLYKRLLSDIVWWGVRVKYGRCKEEWCCVEWMTKAREGERKGVHS